MRNTQQRTRRRRLTAYVPSTPHLQPAVPIPPQPYPGYVTPEVQPAVLIPYPQRYVPESTGLSFGASASASLSASVSGGIGIGGRRFLRETTAPEEQEQPKPAESTTSAAPQQQQEAKAEAEKAATAAVFDDSEPEATASPDLSSLDATARPNGAWATAAWRSVGGGAYVRAGPGGGYYYRSWRKYGGSPNIVVGVAERMHDGAPRGALRGGRRVLKKNARVFYFLFLLCFACAAPFSAGGRCCPHSA
jgi:hypothetical protein